MKVFIAILIALGCATLWAGETASPHAEDRLNEDWWAQRHEAICNSLHGHADAQLILIGDSITQNYEKANPPDENFLPTWRQFYEPRKALNLGFSGDTTTNVLWRLQHGEVSDLHPRVAILLIGTNDTAKQRSAEQTKAGIDAALRELKRQLPRTHVLLLGVLPSDISAEKSRADQRVNELLATSYAHDPRITYLDIGSIFYTDGKLNTAIFYDPRLPWHAKALHPDTNGQHLMAAAIEPTLVRLMGK